MTTVDLGHGTKTSYNKGCRCDECRRAALESTRIWRENRQRRDRTNPLRATVEGWPVEDVAQLPPGWLDGGGRPRYDHRCSGCGLCWIGPAMKNCPRCLLPVFPA